LLPILAVEPAVPVALQHRIAMFPAGRLMRWRGLIIITPANPWNWKGSRQSVAAAAA
jgi:hypothetical protein